jgi:hypothetical protein
LKIVFDEPRDVSDLPIAERKLSKVTVSTVSNPSRKLTMTMLDGVPEAIDVRLPTPC